MGEAKRRKLAGFHAPRVMGDVRRLSGSKVQAYIAVALERAKEVAAKVPEGDKLNTAFEPMLRFVVGGKYVGGCHDTSAVLYMQMRQAGLQEADLALCIGEVEAEGAHFDHSWVEFHGEVFDVAICAPNEAGGFAGGAVFADVDLSTNARTQARFGIASNKPLEDLAASVYRINLSQFLELQKSSGFKSMAELVHEVYGVDGQELLVKYGAVNRELRNPLLNPQKGGHSTSAG